MYKFNLKKSKEILNTDYSPKEISEFYCFDAVLSETGEIINIKTKDINFKSFEFVKTKE